LSTALATIDTSKYLALQTGEDAVSTQDALDAIAAGGGIEPRKLTQVKVPSGGGMSWAVPHPNGEQDFRELVGVVLFATSPRVYYKYKPGERPVGDVDERGGAPDCSSDDGVTGYGIQGEGVAVDCATCPLAQWGSATSGTGRGKACPPRKALYLMMPDRILPVVVNLPQTSAAIYDAYAMSLIQVGQMPVGVETKLTLKREERNGQKYSTLVVTKAADLDVESRKKMQAIGAALKNVLVSSRDA
jgi:hypothetical protein